MPLTDVASHPQVARIGLGPTLADVKVVVHAGLHKSGTTVVQAGWREAYGAVGSAWYPSDKRRPMPGHHYLVWPLLEAFVEPAPDLVMARILRAGKLGSLAATIDEAANARVETLVISSEELDRIRPSDAGAFAEVLTGHDVTVLLTATRPMHRWSSGWQELVKHGLADYPRESSSHILDFAGLRRGRLEEIARLLPASRRIVRLVRTTPPEPDLAAGLAVAVGLPDPDRLGPSPVRNASLGTDIEIVRRINRADLAIGTKNDAGVDVLEELRGAGVAYVEVPGLGDHYQPTPDFWAAAEAEAGFLAREAGSSGVEVLDPHDLLPTWLDPEPPQWYSDISRREAVVPALDDAPRLEEQLWRVRQERSALRAQLRRAEQRRRSSGAGAAGEGSAL